MPYSWRRGPPQLQALGYQPKVIITDGWERYVEAMAHGVPTVGVSTEPVRPEDRLYGHTRADTPDKVYPEGLNECAAISAQVAVHVANLPVRPVPRQSREQMEEMFGRYEFMEPLDLLDMWPPEHVRERYFSFG